MATKAKPKFPTGPTAPQKVGPDVAPTSLLTQAAPGSQAPPPGDGRTDAENAAYQSATGLINSLLATVPGLQLLDPNNVLGSWMAGQAFTLTGQGQTDGTAIFNTIESTMNNPTGDPAAKAVFDQLFPGYNQKIANGTTNTNGQYTGIAGYIQYAAQLQQFSSQAGLAPGTITPQDIGTLWAGDVSANEVSARITDAHALASNTPPEVQNYLSQNYGLTTGMLTSYFLNPTNTLDTITKTLNAGTVGGEAAITGFSPNLSQAQANALGVFLANGSSGGSGSQVGSANPVTAAQANNFFTSNLGTNPGTGNSMGSIAELAHGGFTNTSPGQSPTGTVTEDTLLRAAEGDQAAIANTAQAQQARRAGSQGGGGATTTANGAVGLGFAQS